MFVKPSLLALYLSICTSQQGIHIEHREGSCSSSLLGVMLSADAECEHRLYYKECARRAVSGVLKEAFGLRSREPEQGFNAGFSSIDSAQNLLWKSEQPVPYSSSPLNQLEIDYLGHTTPLQQLPAVNVRRVNQMRHVLVFKSQATQAGTQAAAAETLAGGGVKKADPAEMATEENEVGGEDDEMFQYVVAEITHETRISANDQIQQLERACLFLSSRASPTVEDVSDLNVLATVACVVVVDPTLVRPEKIFNYVRSQQAKFPMVHALMVAGRLVCIRYTRTLTTVMSDTSIELSDMRAETQAEHAEMRAQLAETQAQLADLRTTLDSMAVSLQKILQAQAQAALPPPPPSADIAPDTR